VLSKGCEGEIKAFESSEIEIGAIGTTTGLILGVGGIGVENGCIAAV
jgi:hypothetical protein